MRRHALSIKIPYNSAEGLATAKKVMKIVNDAAYEYSQKLSEEKGCFPNWDISIFGPKAKNTKMRNSALTTIAPTGSISMLLDCSSGVEPFFALAYTKEVMSGQNLTYVNPHLKKELKKYDLYNDEMIKEIEKEGSIQHIEKIPQEIKRIFVTAMDISAEDHIKMQAAFQENVDNSISKTINFPYTATREDVRKGYILAWEVGCKGCTVYRDGSRKEQVLTIKKEKIQEERDQAPKPVQEKVASVKSDKNSFEEIIPPPITEKIKQREHVSLNKKEIIATKKCPECGGGIQIAEGCMLCLNCGFSACSV
ncbi:hypothetical protein GF366_03860 [Candidatus Peregrinibacteria bacterium]|nr:hypothetical protein [Candidatus Peregrinibacteria bacterium]